MSTPLSVFVFACMVSAAALAIADTTKVVSVPAGDLVPALESLAKQCGVNVIYPSEQLKGMKTRGVSGTLEPKVAFQTLIEGNPLTLKEQGGGFLIAQASATAAPSTAAQQKEGKTSSSGVHPLAQAALGQTESPYGGIGLQEIVVTASGRPEPFSQVGAPVSVISGDALLERSANSLRDYDAVLPGVSLIPEGAIGYGVVTIRGIAPQGVAATTATYIDEIPVGASGATTESYLFTADLDPEDLQRIEVLKGPQGTLYGASSLGGVIKYVTRDPNLANTEVTLSQDASYVENGSAGVTLRGALSTPLIDGSLGVRASVYYRHDPGFVDDIGVQGPNVGRANAVGGRLALLYVPTDAFSLKLTATQQESRTIGLSVVPTNTTDFQPTYGAYEQLRYEREGFDEDIGLYSAELHYHFGAFDLLSATGYSRIYPTNNDDATALYQAYGLGSVSPSNPALAVTKDSTNKFTQEFKLTSGRLGMAEFMFGAFYQNESDYFSFGDTLKLTPEADFAHTGAAGTLKEYAGFADVSLFFSPRFDLTLGYRYSRIDQRTEQTISGEVYDPANPDAITQTQQSFSESPSTYLIAPRYHVNENLLFYARAASGYRPGGGRALPAGIPPSYPDFYTSDKIWCYEVGEKFRSSDGRLTIDADAFDIQWSNIQTLQPVPGTVYLISGNAGTARSRGIELQATMMPLNGFTMGASGAFTDARYTQTVPGVAVDGESLANTPKLAGTVWGQYSHEIGNGWNALFEGDYWYDGYRVVESYRAPLPGYGVWNGQVGVQNEHWRVSLYVRNLTNKYARSGANLDGGFRLPYYFVIETPRTVGISLIQRF